MFLNEVYSLAYHYLSRPVRSQSLSSFLGEWSTLVIHAADSVHLRVVSQGLAPALMITLQPPHLPPLSLTVVWVSQRTAGLVISVGSGEPQPGPRECCLLPPPLQRDLSDPDWLLCVTLTFLFSPFFHLRRCQRPETMPQTVSFALLTIAHCKKFA